MNKNHSHGYAQGLWQSGSNKVSVEENDMQCLCS